MATLEPGSQLGGYEILARLRAGGMGVLYLGRRIAPSGFARPVAIKVIHDHLATNKRFVKMFVDEARLAARIESPHVVRVDELAETDGRYYMVMDYVHGVSLAQVFQVLNPRPGIPLDHAVAIAMQIAAGLHQAHEATDEDGSPLGIVHRDVSPGNILVSYGGSVRLIDFGIAKARFSSGNTQTGSLRGKLAYMPPEQARSAKTVDRRADLYALGLILWEMLVGKRMFSAADDLALLALLKNPPITPPSAHGVELPDALDKLVLACLSINPNDRPSTGADLQRLLGEAHPPALRIIAPDLAALMDRVKLGPVQHSADDDEAVDVGQSTLTIFGKSMLESIERAEEISPRLSAEEQQHEPSVIIEDHLLPHEEITGRFDPRLAAPSRTHPPIRFVTPRGSRRLGDEQTVVLSSSPISAASKKRRDEARQISGVLLVFAVMTIVVMLGIMLLRR